MKNSFFKAPARLLTGRALLESENSDATVTTPKGNAKTPRASLQLRQPLTCAKPRPLLLHETSNSLKRRTLPTPVNGDSVKVFIRVKPVMEDDLKQGRTKEALETCDKDRKRGIVLPAANSKENWFSDFDGVLDDATNQEVFDAIGGDLLRQYLSGVNVSIMAYGQTGSGKTYTMFGSSEPDAQGHGLLHLVLDRIEEQVCLRTRHSRLSASVFEVYNDELFSLLDVAGVEKRPLVKGMSDYHQHRPKQVDDAGEVVSLVLEALQLRARDATARNATSSRSHAFVKLRLEQMPAAPDEQGVDSTLFLVDLAGSESMSNASSSTQQCETIHINKSLQALERVVNSLSNCSAHVPYRDSLLTQVLQEGLNPQKARVALVATVSRFLADVHVTKSTLMFAQRARNIRTFAQVNVAARRPPPTCPDEIYRQLQNMQAINNKLRQQLADFESSQERLQGRSSQHVEVMREEIARLMELHSELQRTSAQQQQDAEAALDEERAEHAAARKALEDERAAHAATREVLAEAQRVNVELAETAAAAEAEARGATRSAGELRSRLQEAQLQVVRLNGELAGAQSLGEQMAAQHRAAQEQLAAAREQLTVLRGQLAAAEAGDLAHQRTMQQQLEEAEAARQRDHSEATAFQQRVRDLQQQLAEANDDAAGLAAELAETRKHVAQLQTRISDSHDGVASPLLLQGQEAQAGVSGSGGNVEFEQLELVLQQTDSSAEEDMEEAAVKRVEAEADLQWESSDGAVVLVNELEAVQAQLEESNAELETAREQLRAQMSAREVAEVRLAAQAGELEAVKAELEARTSRLAELEEQLAETREQLVATTAAAAMAEEQLAAAAAAATAEAEAASHAQQLTAAVAARNASSATQEAHAAAEAAARLVPLQTECERLRAMCGLSEQQLSRLQADCERLRAEGSEAREGALRLAAECERLRDAAAKAEAEAAERQARLEAVAGRESGPRSDAALRQLQERVRSLEAEKKRVDADHRGQLELKDKLIRQLENMNEKLQSELTQLQQEVSAGAALAAAATDPVASADGAATSPFASLAQQQQPQQQYSGSHSEAGASPCLGAAGPGPAEGTSPCPPSTSSSAPPSRAPSGGGVYLLNRTITGSAAALARNNSRASAFALSTPPPAPRFIQGLAGQGAVGAATPPSAASKAAAVAVAAPPSPPPPAAASCPEALGQLTPESTPGALEPRLTPLSVPPLDDGLVVVMRRQHRSSPDLKLNTNVARNQVNY